jgi:hypothetical protein
MCNLDLKKNTSVKQGICFGVRNSEKGESDGGKYDQSIS